MTRRTLYCLALILVLASIPTIAGASHISGIRITQTGNTGLMIDVDVTAFYTTGSTTTTAYIGTTYGRNPAIDWGDGSSISTTSLPLAATSTVVNGIPARSYRGSFSHAYAGPGSYTITANTDCCPVTTPTYTLVTGSYVTTSFSTYVPFLMTSTTVSNTFVRNTLPVTAVAPGFSKAFAPAATAVGVPSTLTFTIDNSASTLDDNALDFTDNLPAGLVVATPANTVNTCTGGTLTANSGTAVISYTGGLVGAGATCTISVDVVSVAPGVFANTSGDLTSAFGNSGTASDTLTVTAAPTFTKAFTPNQVIINGTVTLTFVIDNTANPLAATGLSFTDNLPVGMSVAAMPNVFDTCGGTLTAVPAATTISYAGGTVAAGTTCTISVDVTVASGGNLINVADPLGSSLGSSPPGTATATLLVGAPAPDIIEVPTLSTTALIVLGSLLGLLGLGVMRRLH